MSISRLSGLVTLLVVCTLLSVWWYLQVPGPVTPPAFAAEAQPLEVPARPVYAPASSGRWSRRTSSAPEEAAAGKVGKDGGTVAPGHEACAAKGEGPATSLPASIEPGT